MHERMHVGNQQTVNLVYNIILHLICVVQPYFRIHAQSHSASSSIQRSVCYATIRSCGNLSPSISLASLMVGSFVRANWDVAMNFHMAAKLTLRHTTNSRGKFMGNCFRWNSENGGSRRPNRCDLLGAHTGSH